jgi:hypothetical protein
MALFQNQIDKSIEQLENLSGRERMLVGVGGLSAIVLIGFLVFLMLNSSLKNQEANNRDLEIKLERILQKQGEYLAARRKVKQIEQRIRTKGVRSLIPYLDRKSRKFNLRISSMRPIQSESTTGKKQNNVKENPVRIELNKADLSAVARFFQAVERSGRVVKIRKLLMRPNFADPKKVNVVAEVSSFILTQ